MLIAAWWVVSRNNFTKAKTVAYKMIQFCNNGVYGDVVILQCGGGCLVDGINNFAETKTAFCNFI